MDSTFVALNPTDDAQAQLAALIGDDLWRLDRLARIEAGIGLARIEELLGQTQLAEKAGSLTNAIGALGNALTAWEEPPIPADHSPGFTRRLQALSDAIDLVAQISDALSPDLLAACESIISQLRRVQVDDAVPTGAFAALDQAARGVMAELMDRGERVEADQVEMRKAVATIAIPGEKELSKLGRYRRMLEEGLHRRLQALECLRRMTMAASPAAADVDRATEFRVRLRVVS